jgi:hypothetical protein
MKCNRRKGSTHHAKFKISVLFDYTAEKTCVLCPHTAQPCKNKASTESLLTVDCKNIVLRPAQIQFYATGAMKYKIEQRVRHSMHNIKFQSFSITRLKKLVFYVHIRPNDARIRHKKESLLTVDCKNIVHRPAQIQLSATEALKRNRTKGSTRHA